MRLFHNDRDGETALFGRRVDEKGRPKHWVRRCNCSSAKTEGMTVQIETGPLAIRTSLEVPSSPAFKKVVTPETPEQLKAVS